MTLKDVESLLNIADKARGWPDLHGLSNEALKLLKDAKLNTLINIIPVTIQGPVELMQGAKPESKTTFPANPVKRELPNG